MFKYICTFNYQRECLPPPQKKRKKEKNRAWVYLNHLNQRLFVNLSKSAARLVVTLLGKLTTDQNQRGTRGKRTGHDRRLTQYSWKGGAWSVLWWKLQGTCITAWPGGGILRCELHCHFQPSSYPRLAPLNTPTVESGRRSNYPCRLSIWS